MISKINNVLKDFGNSVITALYELKYVRRRNYNLRTLVKVVNSNYKIDTYNGILSPDKKMCFIEPLQCIKVNPVIFDDNGENVVFITLSDLNNITVDNVIKTAEAQKEHALIAFKTGKGWNSMYVQSRGCIDWTHLKNEYEIDYSVSTYKVVQSSLLKYLEEPTNIKLLLIILASFAIGLFIGSMVSGLLHLLINAFQ